MVDLSTRKVWHLLPGARHPYFLDLTGDGKTAVVGHLLPSGAATDPSSAPLIYLLDLENGKKTAAIALPYGASNVGQIKISRDDRWAVVAHTRGRVNLPTSQLEKGWVNTNAVSIIDLDKQELYTTFLPDQVNKGAADPWGIALSPDDKFLYVTSAGTNDLFQIDFERLLAYLQGDDTPAPLKPSDAKAYLAFDVWEKIRQNGADRMLLQNELSAMYAVGLLERLPLPMTGARGLAVSPDGRFLAVAGYFSSDVVVLETQTQVPRMILKLGDKPMDAVRRGETVFHNAKITFQSWLSCATCHPDGRSDGLNWDLLNDGIGNPKNSKSLLLAHKTPPAMSPAVRDDYQTAVNAGFTHILFSKADSLRLRDVEAYIESLQPEVSPYRNGKADRNCPKGEKAVFFEENRLQPLSFGPLVLGFTTI